MTLTDALTVLWCGFFVGTILFTLNFVVQEIRKHRKPRKPVVRVSINPLFDRNYPSSKESP